VVNDWDLTTDAEVEAVLEVVGTEAIVEAASAPYTTQAKITLDDIEVLVQFGIGGVRFPTVVTGEWKGVPVGDPRVWALAYRTMGRPEKGALLDQLSSGKP
jgi:hypothetical protein